MSGISRGRLGPQTVFKKFVQTSLCSLLGPQYGGCGCLPLHFYDPFLWSQKSRNGHSLAGGPKGTKMELFRPR